MKTKNRIESSTEGFIQKFFDHEIGEMFNLAIYLFWFATG